MPAIPNLPVPINGMIKTYDNNQRTFTRPFSAKTIFFYKMGDDYFQGVRIPVSKARYRTMDALLDDLSIKVPLHFGVRKILLPDGHIEVTSIDDLQHMGRYLCSSSTWASKRPFRSLERPQGRLEPLQDQRHTTLNGDFTSAPSTQANKDKERYKRITTTSTPPALGSLNTKQILFTLNGMPNRVYRMQFRTKRMPLFEDVLKEVSDMLRISIAKLFTAEGERVLTVDDIINGPAQLIACQKHERPLIENRKLPPLGASGRNMIRVDNQLVMDIGLSKYKTVDKTDSTGLNMSNSAVPLPPLSPSKRRVKKQLRQRTVSKKRKKKIKISGDENGDLQNAIIQIQSAIRARLARDKYLKQNSDSASAKADIDKAHDAAIKIQAAVRGHVTRKQLKRKKTEAQLNVVNGGTENDQPEVVESVDKPATPRDTVGPEEQDPAVRTSGKRKEKSAEKTDSKRKYNASVFTGNRWAADTDADLYIILIGENGETEKTWLKQNEHEPKFQQNQVDTFDIETKNIGRLKKITVGHTADGYGSGIFIERLVINEVNGDMLQYVFPCSKWFDSAQVDGKLERTITCAGYYNLKTLPVGVHDHHLLEHDDHEHFVTSHGRYRITLHCGKVVADPPEANTNVYLVCYGSYTHSDPYCVWPALSATSAGTVQSFDVDCSNVGELYKIRFESKHSKEYSVSWLLEAVDVRDVDTNEEIHLFCNKWLCNEAPENIKVLHPQLYRELPIIRIGLEPLPSFQYSVALKLSNNLFSTRLPCDISLQLTGEFGDSGIYYTTIPEQPENLDREVKFVIETVSLGRMLHVTYSLPVEEEGEIVAEGLRALSDLFEKHQVASNLSGHPWLIESASVRESTHAPYLFIFTDCRTVESDSPGQIKRRLLLTEMEGLSTKIKPKKVQLKDRQKTSVKDKNDGKWQVFVTTGNHTDAGTDSTPFLIVYGTTGSTKPIPLLDKKQTFTPGSTCQFEVDLKGIGTIFKIRVRLDSQGTSPMWYLKKIKMKDLFTGDELRFPVEMWLEKTEENPEIAVELPAVWPDIPPLPSLLYQVTLHTGTESENETDFDVSIIVYGDKGDSGKRFLRSALGTQSQSCFKPGNVDTFELEAVSVREIKKIQLNLEPLKKTASWFLNQVEVYDPEGDVVYSFVCNKWFSNTKEDKRFERILVPTEITHHSV